MDWMALIQSTLILFAVVNPIGSIPIFLQLTHHLKPEGRQQAFGTGVLTSIIILLIFILVGKSVLIHFFQIELSDLMAAGGLLLLIIAIDHLVFGVLVKSVIKEEEQDAHHIGAVPIACPILAGPGAMMTAFVTYSKFGFLVSAGSILIVFAITWVMLRFLDKIYSFLGKIVCLVLSKILCLFLAAIGIRLLMQGLTHYFIK